MLFASSQRPSDAAAPGGMTQYLSSSQGSGCPRSPARLAGKLAGRADGARESRNQCITEFFQPAPKQAVLCSPEKRNGKVGLPVSYADHPRRNISSPKQNRRKKFPPPPPDKSPIIEAFFKGAKIEKKESSNDDGASITVKTTYPKVVARKLFTLEGSPDGSKDDTLGDLEKMIRMGDLEKSEKWPLQTRTPLVENSRECKMTCVDLDTTSSGLSKYTSASENNSLRKESHVSWCQKTGYSKTLQSSPANALLQSSLENLGRDKQVKKERKMPSKQQPCGSIKKSMATSVFQQTTVDLLRKRSHSASWESSTDDSSTTQASKVALSSGQHSNKAVNIRKSQSCPSVSTYSRTSRELSRHKEHPGKRKRITSNSDLHNSQILDVQNFSSSLEKLPSCQEQKSGKAPSNSLIKSQENSLFFQGSKDLLSHIQNDNCTESLETKIDETHHPVSASDNFPSNSVNSFSKVEAEKTWKDTLKKGFSSVDYDHVTIPNSSCDLNETSNGDSNLETFMRNKKLQSLSDNEDENPGCDLDSSDDEILLSFEEILAQSFKSFKKPEPTKDEEGTIIPPHCSFLPKPSAETRVSYINQLEHLLKEKEEFRRLEELEKQLQQVKWKTERDLSSQELSNDGELSAEHRAFIERFSVIDAIPDQHPGENIFQMSHAGNIFSQHNLDLRNSGLFPQNPLEKYLLSSGTTQQLFVINEGLLMSAYHSSACPIPILKWMFQMMSVHSDRSVSKKILDMLMALTIKNALVSDQPRPWIPSLCDIATVLINLGVPFDTLFPLLHLQPTFVEDNIMSEMCKIVGEQASEDFSENQSSFFLLVQSSLCNMAKFLQLCIGICPDHYTDKEILLLLLLLFKLSLEKELKQFPLVDLECLIIKLLENIRKWDTEMPKFCLAISYLSSHHHDLLWLVQFVPNWTARGRQARRYLSLVVISKLLKNHVDIPSSLDQQMILLCQDVVKMKPSNLLKRIAETKQQQDGLNKESVLSDSEPQAYYLTYVLLHLVREASNFETPHSNQRKWLLNLCSTLEKHVKCEIREDARLFYRTKVKDLVARTYSKWQQMIHSSRPIQGKIHDWLDSDS